MKKLILTAAGFLCLAGATYVVAFAAGDDKNRKDAADEGAPHRIGVVDIEYIFEKYDKVKAEFEDLKGQAQQQEDTLKAMQKRGQELVEELKSLKEDTPEFKAKQEKLYQYQAQFEGKRKQYQTEFKREDARIALTIYQEIQDAVKVVASHNNITLVVKCSRSEAGNANNPMKTQVMMNQAVVFHRKQDDMTDLVLKLLNQRYQKEYPDAKTRDKEEVRPASGEKKSGRVKTAAGSKGTD